MHVQRTRRTGLTRDSGLTERAGAHAARPERVAAYRRKYHSENAFALSTVATRGVVSRRFQISLIEHALAERLQFEPLPLAAAPGPEPGSL